MNLKLPSKTLEKK